jgi:deoxycytidylate deaminase
MMHLCQAVAAAAAAAVAAAAEEEEVEAAAVAVAATVRPCGVCQFQLRSGVFALHSLGLAC